MSEERSGAELLDLLSAAASAGSGAILSRETADLDVNLVRFSGGAGVAPHLNPEVDVLLVGVAGRGTVTVADETFPVSNGKALLIPKGTTRSVRSEEEGEFVYLTIHRRRARLLPRPRQG